MVTTAVVMPLSVAAAAVVTAMLPVMVSAMGAVAAAVALSMVAVAGAVVTTMATTLAAAAGGCCSGDSAYAGKHGVCSIDILIELSPTKFTYHYHMNAIKNKSSTSLGKSRSKRR